MSERVFSLEELAIYDGQDGEAAYVAYEGKVYDLTDSPMWEFGNHEYEHAAGEDHTDAMAAAPHGDDVMDGFPVVGILEA
jgi:predicted heme/steroid binding protein